MLDNTTNVTLSWSISSTSSW